MPFKLILIPPNPEECVLDNEPLISGVDFLEKATSILRKSIEGYDHLHHIPIGPRASYEINVPNDIAIQSGKFINTMKNYITVDSNLLYDFIFYNAIEGVCSNLTRTYSKCASVFNEIRLYSCIDEMRFLSIWSRLNYPENITHDQCVCAM